MGHAFGSIIYQTYILILLSDLQSKVVFTLVFSIYTSILPPLHAHSSPELSTRLNMGPRETVGVITGIATAGTLVVIILLIMAMVCKYCYFRWTRRKGKNLRRSSRSSKRDQPLLERISRLDSNNSEVGKIKCYHQFLWAWHFINKLATRVKTRRAQRGHLQRWQQSGRVGAMCAEVSEEWRIHQHETRGQQVKADLAV